MSPAVLITNKRAGQFFNKRLHVMFRFHVTESSSLWLSRNRTFGQTGNVLQAFQSARSH